ncbi:MAG: flagellar hook-associated protein FlgK [Eubacteriales bacterium]|nr:flagellar hook-associated protein FlgK [Eubacteriales bacterium]
MGSISSMSVALSGLKAAQAGLSVTGHNVSNSAVAGYTRQQAIQQDFYYRNLGPSPVGSLKNQAGLGTQVGVIRQIRNKFYDINYREQNSAGNFYARKYTAGEEINNIIGELQSDYRAQDAINSIWNSVNEVIKDPGAIETRSLFIQTCVTFLNKMQDINKNLFEYQLNLNEQIKEEVNSINNIVEQIARLNEQIQQIECDGRRANDLRDSRNLLLDELSGYLDIEVKESPIPGSYASRMDILINGQELLVNNIPNKIGLKYANGEYPFYEPVFTSSTEILPADANATKVFPNLANEDLSSHSGHTKGSLKGLLVSRGNTVGNYTMIDNKSQEINNFLIPEVQAKIDNLVHEIVTLINETAIGKDLNGNTGVPIFVRKGTDDSKGVMDPNNPGNYLTPEDVNDYKTLFTLENIQVNPALLENDGYNKLGFSISGDIGDTTILEEISQKWKEGLDSLGGASIDGYYKQIITDFAVEIQGDRQMLESKIGTIDLAENKRYSLSAVSLDEELSNMLKFQHAYNSAAKVINVIDSMLDKVINGTGRVGI